MNTAQGRLYMASLIREQENLGRKFMAGEISAEKYNKR
jgi:hypothetical protein